MHVARGTVLAVMLVLVVLTSSAAVATTCNRDDFAGVVEDSAAALRKMNADNTPNLQRLLRSLKDKNKWSHEEFMTKAAVYVRDDRIATFDGEINSLLNKIEAMGDGGSGKEPNCALLQELRGLMQALVQTTQAKWDYMFAKIEQGLKASP
jgi:hypothetical protein